MKVICKGKGAFCYWSLVAGLLVIVALNFGLELLFLLITEHYKLVSPGETSPVTRNKQRATRRP